MRARALVLLALSGPAAAAQSLEQRIGAAPVGEVRFRYTARPGVYGDGRNRITWDRFDVNRSQWRPTCDSGPVHVALTKRGSEVVRLRVYVGGATAAMAPAMAPGVSPGGVTDLGTVGAPEAARYLLALARSAASGVGEKAIFAATLADSVTLWPDLLRLARDANVSRRTRRTAVFWVGQAADEAATRGLDDLAVADTVDREVREAAVFALSQQPRDVGIPALIRIARTHRDPDVRRKAIFWLGQSNDPRALALFEEILNGRW